MPIQCEYYALEGLGQLLRNVGLVPDEPQPDARRPRDRADDVRRPDQARRPGGAGGAGALRRQGLPDGGPPHGPPLGGAVVRAADHRVRSDLPGRHRLPGAGEGGERWPDAADWVRDSAPSSRSDSREATRMRRSEELPVAPIEPNPHQPRAHFDEEALGSLADSIRELGVLQPVLVRPRSTTATS